ncbi:MULTISPECIES: acyl-CoA dehydrogenase family protein [unclassified Nocardioides]|uniref:acyl-CoA dehydrogenase family protein n=1 Tax=unclassified Nocardioides TaxID=2615069 RepID=UPI0007034F8D|nr:MULTISPECIES: acyl-CoA dehydrogenase family protein [unclassified Nocardioides]KRC54066.1 acyl-CoA dehydrogenase [Nocardioides sp. Root79]KRC71402.1 acyl-CoA dehydrogenase [Nocardioides sp. Root240]
MDFGWSEGQRHAFEELLAAIGSWQDDRSVADSESDLRAARHDLASWGLLGLSVPERYGGGGLDVRDTALRVQAFGDACTDMGLVFATAAHLFACAMPIAEFGTEEARERFLPSLCSGALVAGNAMTESGAGSDLSKLGTRAVAVDGGYLLSGEKSFVTNGPIADLLVTYAQTDPTAGYLGITAFVVETRTPGIHLGPPMDKMGLDSASAGIVAFGDCFVPSDQVLGAIGQGTEVFNRSMRWERTCLFAGYVGSMDRLLRRTVEHAQTRSQFGRPIGDFQAVAHRIAEMKSRLEAARLLLYRACWAIDVGEHPDQHIALAKLAVSEAAVANALDAVAVFGAWGYLSDHGIEVAVRDATAGRIFSGTSDVQKLIIARELGL